MAEYIKRETVCKNCKNINICTKDDKCPVIRTVAADVAPVVHGRWIEEVIEVSDFDGDWLAMKYHCSLCGRVEYRKEPYCHCGAKMDGEKKEDD